jgi:amino acid adenylation domain-containing protein
MRVEDDLFTAARTSPAKTAIVAGDGRITYADLATAAAALARELAAAGIGCGDRVLIPMDNSIEAAIAIYGVLAAGAVFAPINPSTKVDKLAHLLADSGAAAVLTEARLAGTVAAAIERAATSPLVWSTSPRHGGLPAATRSFEAAIAGSGLDRPTTGPSSDLAMLVYTSGSTGLSKGVMMTHDNVAAAAGSIVAYLGLTADDVILSTLPLAFDYGLYQVLMSVRTGARVVLERTFAFPRVIFEKIDEERATVFPLVPTTAALILRMDGLEPDFLPSIRLLTNTAAALPVSHIEQLRRLFPRARLFSMYGLTECKRCTFLPPEELDRRPDSVGIAIPGTEVFVLDDDGRRVAPGVVGELFVRGLHVMQGYWRDPVATAERLRPDPETGGVMLATGDLFRADADGFLYFVARRDDMLKTRGVKVAPKEIEAVLAAHPAVAEVVVVGVPDPLLGQAIVALVVPRRPDLDVRELAAHAARHLEDHLIPSRIELRTALPETDSGKVSRRLAGELLQREPRES